MALPISYNIRNLIVRWKVTLLAIGGIALVVAVMLVLVAMSTGFRTALRATGSPDNAIVIQRGQNSELTSGFTRDNANMIMVDSRVARDDQGKPLASPEIMIVNNMPRRQDGSSVNVVVRGVTQQAFKVRSIVKIVEGRNFTPGSDEVIVGKRLVGRIEHCQLGDVIEINTSPFRVVGVFEHEGSFGGEIWGDLDRLLAVLDRYGPNRVLAQLKPGVVLGAPDPMLAFQKQDPVEPEPGTLAARLLEDREVPAKVMTEKQYLNAQTAFLSFTLLGLVGALGLIMGLAAVFSATNTMLSAVAARTAEIGILLSMGFRRIPIFLSFLLESLLLGLLGGLAGCVMALPFNGIDTGTMNFQTFTELQFAFRVTPTVLTTAVVFALVLGLLGGALPAWRAARMTPTDALRRR